MPDRYLEYGRRWEELNPDWKLLHWTEDNLPPLRNQAVIDDIKARDAGRNGLECAVQMADVIGYELIWRYGGLYVNTDIEPVRSMQDLFDQYNPQGNAYAPFEDPGMPVNCAIGGPKEHEFWDALIEHLPTRYFGMPGEEMNVTTGPHLLTYMWNMNQGIFTPLAQESFNAIHWKQIEIGSDATGKVDYLNNPRIIGIHHWGHRKTPRTNYVETATQ